MVEEKRELSRRLFVQTVAFSGAAATVFGRPWMAEELYTTDEITETLGKTRLVEMYKQMLRIREFERKMKEWGMQGKYYHNWEPYTGQEASAVGACAILEKDDYISYAHRGCGPMIARGVDLKRLLTEVLLKSEGLTQGKGGHLHWGDFANTKTIANSIMGESAVIGVGLAIAAKVKKTKQVTLAFFGDGSSNRGIVHESINLASHEKLPVVFVCENNLYAGGFGSGVKTYPNKMNVKDVALRASGYGIPGVIVDGNDVLDVAKAAKAAADRARQGSGPTLLETKTYMWYSGPNFAGAKIGVDGAWGISPKADDELRHWMTKDPIKRFGQYLMDSQILDVQKDQAILSDVEREVQDAAVFAESRPTVNPSAIAERLYA